MALLAFPEATIRSIDSFAFNDLRPDIHHIKVQTLFIPEIGDNFMPLVTTYAKL
jgi:hypothetical protein